uniref:Uncharacterized protein n=1 Tax=Anguilla anguilla TaxID=7936 RepID=A0A0E9Y0B2_ANGAN
MLELKLSTEIRCWAICWPFRNQQGTPVILLSSAPINQL